MRQTGLVLSELFPKSAHPVCRTNSGSMVGVPVVPGMTTIIRLVISLLSMMVSFAVPMLTIERLTVPCGSCFPCLCGDDPDASLTYPADYHAAFQRG